MKACPKCGKPMKIERETYGRVWRCTDWYRMSGEACITTVKIPSDMQLSIMEMAEDMARHFGTSGEHGKKQAGYRRIAGSLEKLDRGKEYLSDSEIKTLKKASMILQRLGDAAERAKREKGRIEEEDQRRREKREKEANKLLDRALDAENMVAMAIEVLALAEINNYHCPWSPGWVKRMEAKHRAGGSLQKSLEREIRHQYVHQRKELATSIAWREDPVEDMVNKAQRHVEAQYEKLKNAALIQELRENLAVEDAPNEVGG